MTSVSHVRISVHNRCLDFRAMDRLVQSPEFEQAFKLDPNNVFIQFAILSGNVTEVDKWVKATLGREIGEMSIRNLRDVASRLGIRYYSSLTRDELIVKIIQIKHDRRVAEAAIGLPNVEGRPHCQSVG